ncbi:hypothetical protein L6452_37287 [Arctium lappa]|uniref:Uncharacterized protein n=1 Tax=Arctium lappa TaxID=4217 RepID=A0ACB8Y2H5_ARCLA|nr:hypothetical protein L6452_37287 [Arctium lappa]
MWPRRYYFEPLSPIRRTEQQKLWWRTLAIQHPFRVHFSNYRNATKSLLLTCDSPHSLCHHLLILRMPPSSHRPRVSSSLYHQYILDYILLHRQCFYPRT